jgi:hypothetical protein
MHPGKFTERSCLVYSIGAAGVPVHFLQQDHIRVDSANNSRCTIQIDLVIRTFAMADVISDNPEGRVFAPEKDEGNYKETSRKCMH